MGVDINIMASNSWQAASLPYVAGLGPRKAHSLLQAVQADDLVLNRGALWNGTWKPGKAVFRCHTCSSLSLYAEVRQQHIPTAWFKRLTGQWKKINQASIL